VKESPACFEDSGAPEQSLRDCRLDPSARERRIAGSAGAESDRETLRIDDDVDLGRETAA
jgi:hypothetical protein